MRWQHPPSGPKGPTSNEQRADGNGPKDAGKAEMFSSLAKRARRATDVVIWPEHISSCKSRTFCVLQVALLLPRRRHAAIGVRCGARARDFFVKVCV